MWTLLAALGAVVATAGGTPDAGARCHAEACAHADLEEVTLLQTKAKEASGAIRDRQNGSLAAREARHSLGRARARSNCGANGNNGGRELQKVYSVGSCHCQQECFKNPACQAWSFIPGGLFKMGEFNCQLRSSVGGYVDNCDGRCRSGTRPASHWLDPSQTCGVNGNNRGHELAKIQTHSPCQCELECFDNPRCEAWSFIPDGLWSMGWNNCQLRSSVGGYEDNCNGRCRSGTRSDRRPEHSDPEHHDDDDDDDDWLYFYDYVYDDWLRGASRAAPQSMAPEGHKPAPVSGAA